MVTTERYHGIVRSFSMFRGGGTIVMSDGREVTVRYSAIRGEGVRKLEKGCPVSFLLEERRQGLYAVCVQQE